MKNFQKVTILGTLLGSGVWLFGCEAAGGRQVVQQVQIIDTQADAREAAQIEASLSECRAYLAQGEEGKALPLLEAVLRKRPDHPEAMFYWEKLNTKSYVTVYPGNTLSGIAAYYYDDGQKWPVLARANAIESPGKLRPYARILIPWCPACKEGKDEAGRVGNLFFGGSRPTKIVLHPVREGDSLEALAKQHYGDKRLRYFLADYNRIEDPWSLEKVSSLKIPVFPPRKTDKTQKDREALAQGDLAMKSGEYEKACRYFASVPEGSPYRKEARSSMERCRAQGGSHYDRLGDEAFQNSEPNEACRHWKTALRVDPERPGVKKKLAEAEDLVKALELLPASP